jgi:hypothetical protein
MLVPMRSALDATTAQLSGELTLGIAVNGARPCRWAAGSTGTAPGGS